MAKIDLYNLKASPSQPQVGTEELQMDLQLTLSTVAQSGIIRGTVTSGGNLLPDATVKVFATDGTPLYHANTGSNGQYVIPDVIKGSYVVTAAKEGYLTPVATSVSVLANQPTTANFSLTVDPDGVLNAVYGKIRTPAPTAAPIPEATVNIYQVTGTTNTLIASTLTNTDGQYLFPYLADGNYVVAASKTNYLPQESSEVTVANTAKANLSLALTPLASASLGTVSGFISDAVTGNAISNATVGLYEIVGTEETLIQLTKTNLNGRYLFGNVDDGEYLVKAFAQTNAPV